MGWCPDAQLGARECGCFSHCGRAMATTWVLRREHSATSSGWWRVCSCQGRPRAAGCCLGERDNAGKKYAKLHGPLQTGRFHGSNHFSMPRAPGALGSWQRRCFACFFVAQDTFSRASCLRQCKVPLALTWLPFWMTEPTTLRACGSQPPYTIRHKPHHESCHQMSKCHRCPGVLLLLRPHARRSGGPCQHSQARLVWRPMQSKLRRSRNPWASRHVQGRGHFVG